MSSKASASRGDGRPLNEVFGANIRRLRKRREMSVAVLARRCGYTPAFVAAVEEATARGLSLTEVVAFATALDVDVVELVKRHVRS